VSLNVLTSERNIRSDSLARLTDNKSTEENTFCLSNNDNELEAVTDVAVQDQKSSDGMDNTRSWVDMEVALKVVEEQGTAGAENKIDLQTVCQDAVGTDANGPVPNPMAAALLNVPLKRWIKCAKLSIGTNDGKNAVASPRFLQPALTIALCLAEQIGRSEITVKVNMIANWAKYIVVWMRQLPLHRFLYREDKRK
jgi:hypothetical protein